MADLQKGLLGGKKVGREHKKRFDECKLRVRTLKNKNNEMQKQCDNDVEGDIRQAIRSQSSFIEVEIGELRRMFSELTRDFTDPASKQKLKDLWVMAAREIERNKIIMGQFVNRASATPSLLRGERAVSRRSKTEFDEQRPLVTVREMGPSVVESDDGQLQLQARIIEQKNALLKELEEKNCNINRIMKEMGEQVGGEQKDMVDLIEANMEAARDNVVGANDELAAALVEQKKARKKYTCIAVVIIVSLIVAASVIYLFVK